MVDFNSHAHVERDATSTAGGIAGFNFNSHAHVERDMQADTFHDDLVNFNSHAHVERDCIRNIFQKCVRISTHTLTWSVTGKGC